MGWGKGVAHVILVFNHIDNQLPSVQMYDSNKPSSDSGAFAASTNQPVHVDEGPDKNQALFDRLHVLSYVYMVLPGGAFSPGTPAFPTNQTGSLQLPLCWYSASMMLVEFSKPFLSLFITKYFACNYPS